MSGYVYRDKARRKCLHVGRVWSPPNREVARVACPYCKASAGSACIERGRRVEPHATRYLAHHAANCPGRDWTATRVTAGREPLAAALALTVCEKIMGGHEPGQEKPCEACTEEGDTLAPAALAWLVAELDRPETVEAVAERISWDGGDFTRYSPTAHPDHNRWSWRGAGHSEVLRAVYRQQATAALAVVRERVGGGG